ncbi:thiamine pyrophosphate-binding protein [Loigolactobacillus binensis]|uniref:Thiamine pyrophosphate-binding protein n=1 Tax=Loigolactobacillus binensis TaxID=2559922 RepID=A0ABW3EBJ5_9LACO|nr:thiamine pyrophosphate-binding protein [Loigolactobacillus binensis]
MSKRSVAKLVVDCLENEGVKYVWGVPGEENIFLVNELSKSSKIKFVLTRSEQGAAFMAAIYGQITRIPGVCISTLGPGALNMILGVADANTSSIPLVAISAQGNLARLHKDSHQILDLVSIYKPVTQYAGMAVSPESIPEMIRKCFSIAKRDRPGAAYLAIPEDIERTQIAEHIRPLDVDPISIT